MDMFTTGMAWLAAGLTPLAFGITLTKRNTPDLDWRHDSRFVEARRQLAEVRAKAHELLIGADSAAELRRKNADAIERLEIRKLLNDDVEAELDALLAQKAEMATEIESLEAREVLLQAAVRQQTARAEVVENVVQSELVPEVRARHRELSERHAKNLRTASESNDALRELCELTGGWCRLPAHHWPELTFSDSEHHTDGNSRLSRWIREARSAGYNV